MTDKEKVFQLFELRIKLDYSAIAKGLNLDLETVVRICAELEAEGKIGPADGEELS